MGVWSFSRWTALEILVLCFFWNNLAFAFFRVLPFCWRRWCKICPEKFWTGCAASAPCACSVLGPPGTLLAPTCGSCALTVDWTLQAPSCFGVCCVSLQLKGFLLKSTPFWELFSFPRRPAPFSTFRTLLTESRPVMLWDQGNSRCSLGRLLTGAWRCCRAVCRGSGRREENRGGC